MSGRALPAPGLTRAETDPATRLLPGPAATAATWNVAVMELGALVCTARSPRCGDCPVADLCAWQRAGRPAYDGPARELVKALKFHAATGIADDMAALVAANAPARLLTATLVPVPLHPVQA